VQYWGLCSIFWYFGKDFIINDKFNEEVVLITIRVHYSNLRSIFLFLFCCSILATGRSLLFELLLHGLECLAYHFDLLLIFFDLFLLLLLRKRWSLWSHIFAHAVWIVASTFIWTLFRYARNLCRGFHGAGVLLLVRSFLTHFVKWKRANYII